MLSHIFVGTSRGAGVILHAKSAMHTRNVNAIQDTEEYAPSTF